MTRCSISWNSNCSTDPWPRANTFPSWEERNIQHIQTVTVKKPKKEEGEQTPTGQTTTDSKSQIPTDELKWVLELLIFLIGFEQEKLQQTKLFVHSALQQLGL